VATANMIRKQKLSEVVDAFKRMLSVDEAARKLSQEIAREKEEERKREILSS